MFYIRHMHKEPVNIFWFRRDLRLDDNAGLYHALRAGSVVPIFIFDTNILDDLEDKHDARVQFIRDAIVGMQEQLEKIGSTLHVLHGTPAHCFKQLLGAHTIAGVYTNTDYEPYATQRDTEIATMLLNHG